MSEDRFEMLLGPFVLGELTDEEEQELERHLEECPACQNDSTSYAAPTACCGPPRAGPPPELKEWVLARAEREAPFFGGRWRIWLPWPRRCWWSRS